ncbi:MAG: hypothetical protein ACYC96_16610 [Fimbriimonadaceae bacterium]
MLAASVRSYDDGELAEGDRIANEIALIAHTKGQSVGLLRQLGLENLNFRSSHDSRRTGGAIWNHLCNLRLEAMPARVSACPMFNDAPAWCLVRFEEWWDGEVVILCEGHSITRRQIIRWVRDTDGAHVDRTMPPAYVALQSWFGFAMKIEEPWPGSDAVAGQHISLADTHRACVRQIAHEVLSTTGLRKFMPT